MNKVLWSQTTFEFEEQLRQDKVGILLPKTSKQFHNTRQNVIYALVTGKEGSQLIGNLFDLTKQGRLSRVASPPFSSFVPSPIQDSARRLWSLVLVASWEAANEFHFEINSSLVEIETRQQRDYVVSEIIDFIRLRGLSRGKRVYSNTSSKRHGPFQHATITLEMEVLFELLVQIFKTLSI